MLENFIYEAVENGYKILGIKEEVVELIIPEGVVEIGENAFLGQNFVTVTFPDSLVHINRRAFARCNYLIQINFAENSNLKYIGEQAFLECDAITEISIPEGVEEICFDAFAACYSLEFATVPSSVKVMGEEVFTWIETLVNIKVIGKGIPPGWHKKWNATDAEVIFVNA